MKKAPAFQFYPKDYESDENVKMMSLEQEGAFLRLLCHSWLHGSIPSEVAALAKICRVPPSKMARLWPGVAPCFTEKTAGRMVNPRQERDRAAQEQHRAERAEAGKRGAEKKWGGMARPSNGDGSAIKEPLAKDGSPFSVLRSPSPSARTERTERPIEAAGPKANPFVDGKRDEYEREAMRLTWGIAELTGRDGAEVFAAAAHYEGAMRQKVNPAGLTDDRLLNTVLDLRATLKAEQDKRHTVRA